MKCTNCESELPSAQPLTSCPACGKMFNRASEPPARNSGSQPASGVKLMGWLVVLLSGMGLILTSFIFAGCDCGGNMH